MTLNCSAGRFAQVSIETKLPACHQLFAAGSGLSRRGDDRTDSEARQQQTMALEVAREAVLALRGSEKSLRDKVVLTETHPHVTKGTGHRHDSAWLTGEATSATLLHTNPQHWE